MDARQMQMESQMRTPRLISIIRVIVAGLSQHNEERT